MLDEQTEHDDLVQNPEIDVAQNEYLEKITVGVEGRARVQKIYVRALNGKRSTLE